jgi:predicted phosphodiesterase
MTESSLNLVTFYAMSDGPYGSKARQSFTKQLQCLESRPEFLVHLGDVHERKKECTLSHFDSTVDDLLRNVHVPTFVLPGDADGYECNDQSAAWNKWSEKRFLHFEQNWPIIKSPRKL